jgi:2-aminoethylphosphonate-pyruvate transaminase
MNGAPVEPGIPKGLLEFGGRTLVERSLDLLQERGVKRTILVLGYRAEAFRDVVNGRTGIEVVVNEAYADSGAMASLARALPLVREDFLLLESDLLFEGRALDILMDGPSPDAVLASGFTGAGDEVWVRAEDGLLMDLAKGKPRPSWAVGEFVGLCRISGETGEMMARHFRDFVERTGHERMEYEMEALVDCAGDRAISVPVVDDLIWGEVDDENHYRRLVEEVWPRCRAREGGEGGAFGVMGS